ncbi:MAG: hypothetical protein ACRDNO_20640 [Trebonia sp.]
MAIFGYVKYIVVYEMTTTFRVPPACGKKHTFGISQLPALVPVLPWRSLIGRLLFGAISPFARRFRRSAAWGGNVRVAVMFAAGASRGGFGGGEGACT